MTFVQQTAKAKGEKIFLDERNEHKTEFMTGILFVT